MQRKLLALLVLLALHGGAGDAGRGEDAHEYRDNMVIRKLPADVKRRLEEAKKLEGTDWEGVASACLQIGREDLSWRVLSMIARMRKDAYRCPSVFYSSYGWVASYSIDPTASHPPVLCSCMRPPAQNVNFLQTGTTLEEALARYAEFHRSVYFADRPPDDTRALVTDPKQLRHGTPHPAAVMLYSSYSSFWGLISRRDATYPLGRLCDVADDHVAASSLRCDAVLSWEQASRVLGHREYRLMGCMMRVRVLARSKYGEREGPVAHTGEQHAARGASAVDAQGRPRGEDGVETAMLDWWMLGRAQDAVLTDMSSFGYSATARSLFNTTMPITIKKNSEKQMSNGLMKKLLQTE
ncbi:hypothetical protein GUITHDRAFT_117450 [Guillardia theta CCMP2712]|uniref:Uncharacterized protein n=1 Tax=Guillardia theta (strain CCMP2712) TaxID=905079 RepID=L1IKM3_GUITC|nr:hypothetical protein GUITHDRAFT_117450 [Guillardia theta CCMP2712]EKX36340.1 hypothetical protein GUITHDRAFT_117450 [Guillardia theta CCMP2712]|eukprot:XP_005823320.1 hypothetical protein GUITHDRAFT_117450 [Guillardia theta CCMP2712]